MLIASACLMVLVAAACFRLCAKDPPMDPEVVRRVQRRADQIRREQLLPDD